VAETLKSECGLDVGIKWPNDILIGDKKVCGILTEVSATVDMVDYVVVGIGIDLNVDVNLFPPELRSGATSLKMELEREIQSVKLVQKFPEILKEWRILSTTIGNYVEVHKRGRTLKGEAVGINKDGVLIVELDDGTLKKVLSGECIHVKK
jgi:BirA family biotin operon repressor/biotin-[acetyl-CoA-carboxylase] ligase